jgi:non-heme chloroperoxidase
LELRRELDKLVPGREDQNAKAVIDKLLKEELPRFERDLQIERKNLEFMTPAPVSLPPVLSAMVDGAERFTKLPLPVLAIYAIPAPPAPRAAEGSTAASLPRERVLEIAQAFQSVNPSARVVRLENAQHDVFRSNEPDVIREMRSFIDALPRRD